MKITKSTVQGRNAVTIFEIDGFINLGTSSELEKQARELYDSGGRYLFLDLSNVTSLSSAGLRSILYIYKLFEGISGKSENEDRKSGAHKQVGKSTHLKLINPRPEIRRILNISGFEQFIEIIDNNDLALNSI